MALHAATVGILVEKAKFEPEVALGVAEAIELAMTQAQFVTVPILDARLHGVSAEIRVLEGKLDASTKEHKADMQRARNLMRNSRRWRRSSYGRSFSSCWEAWR